MRRIGSFIIKNAPPVVTPPDDTQIIKDNSMILNDHEPLSSNEDPSPATANYYRADDYVYHHVNSVWKRTSINKFNL
jgi:hypothetical protein